MIEEDGCSVDEETLLVEVESAELSVLIWSAPAERSADGAMDFGQPSSELKRCRAALATALQNKTLLSKALACPSAVGPCKVSHLLPRAFPEISASVGGQYGCRLKASV